MSKTAERIISFEGLMDELAKTVMEIDRDERFHYPNATVFENAPLALIQLNMETRVGFAQEILGRLGYEGPAMKVRKGPKGKGNAK